MARASARYRLAALALLLLSTGSLGAEGFRSFLVDRQIVEARLREYSGTNEERGARLKRMFAEVGCGVHLTEQFIRYSKAPNVICVLPGSSERTIIVGAHFDRTIHSDGVADNWSGASLLPSLYEAVKIDPRHHTYVFIGFTDEERGLVGSRYYVKHLSPGQVAATAAMINIDTLGLAPTEVWTSRSDKRLVGALVQVAEHLQVPLIGMNFENVGSTDSESFRNKKIPRLTIHSLTQQSHDAQILHTKRDKLSAMNLDHYFETYRLVSLYLAYLDEFLGEPPPAAKPPD